MVTRRKQADAASRDDILRRAVGYPKLVIPGSGLDVRVTSSDGFFGARRVCVVRYLNGAEVANRELACANSGVHPADLVAADTRLPSVRVAYRPVWPVAASSVTDVAERDGLARSCECHLRGLRAGAPNR